MVIPIRIGFPSGGEGANPAMIIDMAVAVQPSFYETLRRAEQSYRRHMNEWTVLAARIRRNQSDPVPKLELGRSLDAFFHELESAFGFQVTNEGEALTRQLGISKSALDYIRRASRKFVTTEVSKTHLSWMQVQEMTDIRDSRKARECLKLVGQKVLISQDDIRRFKKAANSRDVHAT